jgi:hypothetical protein
MHTEELIGHDEQLQAAIRCVGGASSTINTPALRAVLDLR